MKVVFVFGFCQSYRLESKFVFLLFELGSSATESLTEIVYKLITFPRL